MFVDRSKSSVLFAWSGGQCVDVRVLIEIDLLLVRGSKLTSCLRVGRIVFYLVSGLVDFVLWVVEIDIHFLFTTTPWLNVGIEIIHVFFWVVEVDLSSAGSKVS